MSERPRVLIEEWLPIEKVGAESQRDRSMGKNSFPGPFRLHVWWARRPLTVSRAAILASLLPAWSEDWPKALLKEFPTRESYHDWFTKLLGIFGDPATVRKAIIRAKEEKVNLGPNPYGYSRAFTYNPSPEQLQTFQMLLKETWGTSDPGVLDAFAGGGSIPFEALRYGFTTFANELNPVAFVILKATLEYPARFGAKLPPLIRNYGKILTERVLERLEPYFPIEKGERIHAYVWARTVKCPYTGKLIPLSPNWWLVTGSEPVAAQPMFGDGDREARFRILRGKSACERAKPEAGTVRRGDGVSPWDHNQIVDGDYIKAEAKAGRMGQQLYAVGIKTKSGFEFRAASPDDLSAARSAEKALKEKLPGWERRGLVPSEQIPDGSKTSEALRYGYSRWSDLFSPRLKFPRP